ncbi:MAG: YihY/virulence factor BrkB family protein [Halofilum sp. (in: g-proteobacteria)]
MHDALDRLRSRLDHFVWHTPVTDQPYWRRQCVQLLRLAQVIARDLMAGALTLRAMSLVFTTLLALVPLIAVSFSVLKGFGVHNRIEPVLHGFLAPLGPRADEITERIVGFVDNIEVRVLGAVGIGLLLYTAVSLVQKVEEAFNYTWNVSRRRTLVRRFSDYFSVIVVGPVLVFTAIGITATLTSHSAVQALVAIEPFGSFLRLAGRLVPYLLVIAAFTFLYMLIPNTRVRLGPALFGGVVAGVVWETVGRLFAAFVATSTNYTAIYSGFAILLLFMIWLQLSWLILLTGSSIAYYRQHPEQLLAGGRGGVRLSGVQTERLALALMRCVVTAWYSGEPPVTRDGLVRRLAVPGAAVDAMLEALADGGLLAPGGEEAEGWLPATPPERTSVRRVIDVARQYGSLHHVLGRDGVPEARAMAAVDAALEQALGPMMVADLVTRPETEVDPMQESVVERATSRDGRR